ncbi:2-oxoglutarate ferredoxin oxidoreductase subunit beta [Steroidobacter denitrificans]|uniref:2-oxoglutarate ferredoxin oxidoreductase subunit beta n=1 Tax=Steroidobacter denitrificans TaxID=465721 RepID=A0A127FA96_STEDE|nr:2-oxoglutarate ferredoxin oxidoreductase subunit beta [Steroidobacter denitrificans]
MKDPDSYRSGVKPVWCPGCGDYSVLSALTNAMSALQLPPEQVALISGIGCSSRIPTYVNVYGFHGVHGRALPLATGLKLARPDLTVLAAGGDGDGFSIGGNHFLHACRRNVDMTYIIMDNEVYGMTKGQASPTTAPDWTGSDLTPAGTGLTAFQPLLLALVTGANFIARCFSGDPANLAEILVEAIRHPGFSVVQILSPCPTFRPEQRQWKNQVREIPDSATADFRSAARFLMEDDGLSVGRILYRTDRKPFALSKNRRGDISELDMEFVL